MPRAPDLAGSILDERYELHELIGEGTFGRVYRGRDRRLRRPVAIKVIKPWWSDDPAWVERFEREAQLLARVNDPGIVQIFDVGHADEGLYYVAELIEGESLAERLRDGALAPAEATRIAERLARALAHAHAQRVVHRDVKPANILLSADGRVKVSDFGVARLAEGSSHGAGGTAIGTPRYMSPEQARGQPTTAASDVYGVGVVLFEMLAGSPPFAGEAAVDVAVRHIQDPPPPLPEQTPVALAAIVSRALEKAPQDRYADGGALADALGEVAASLPRPARRPEAAALAGRHDAHTTTFAVAGPDAPSEAATRIVVPDEARTSGVIPDAARTTVIATGDHATRVVEPHDAGDEAGATRVSRRRPAPPQPRRRWTRRRRRRVLLGALGALVALVAISLIVHGSRTTVPQMLGLRQGGAVARAQRAHLRVRFDRHYSSRPAGTVISQHPDAGKRAGKDSRLQATLSAGPRPVVVPSVIGQDAATARATLKARGLLARITEVSSPGSAPGAIVQQAPAPPAQAQPGATVALSVAAAPQWRIVTSLSGRDDGSSVAFRIRGQRWRVRYSMAYDGSCTLLLVCFGPSVQARTVPGGERVDVWSLDKGDGRVRTIQSAPGVYQLTITRGDDHARWTMEVEDFS